MSQRIITPTEARMMMAKAICEAIRTLPEDVDLDGGSSYLLQEFADGHIASDEIRLTFETNGYNSPCGVRISLKEEDFDFCRDWATQDMTPYMWHVALDCVVADPDFRLNVEGFSFRDLQAPWAVAQAASAAIEAMPHIAEGAGWAEIAEQRR